MQVWYTAMPQLMSAWQHWTAFKHPKKDDYHISSLLRPRSLLKKLHLKYARKTSATGAILQSAAILSLTAGAAVQQYLLGMMPRLASKGVPGRGRER